MDVTAKAIRTWREVNARMTREGLAHALDVSVSTILRWEDASYSPRILDVQRMEKIATGLVTRIFRLKNGSSNGHAKKSVAKSRS